MKTRFSAALGNIRSRIIEFSWWEMLIMRLLCAWLAYNALPLFIANAETPHPNGLAHWIELGFLADPGTWKLLRAAAIAGLVLYVLGFFSGFGLLAATVALILCGTLYNSQGAIGHSRQMLVLVMLGQCAVYFWDFSRRLWRREFPKCFDDPSRQRLLIHAARVMIAAVYLTSAISKIDRSNGTWLWDTPKLSFQIIKTEANDFANFGGEQDPFRAETLPNWIAEHPALARILFAPGLLIELFLVLGLMGRGWSAAMGLTAILLHQMIGWMLLLEFPLHEYLLWIFFVNVPFWIVWAAGKIIRASRRGNPQML